MILPDCRTSVAANDVATAAGRFNRGFGFDAPVIPVEGLNLKAGDPTLPAEKTLDALRSYCLCRDHACLTGLREYIVVQLLTRRPVCR